MFNTPQEKRVPRGIALEAPYCIYQAPRYYHQSEPSLAQWLPLFSVAKYKQHATAHNSNPKNAHFLARRYLHWRAQISCQKLHLLLAYPSVVQKQIG